MKSLSRVLCLCGLAMLPLTALANPGTGYYAPPAAVAGLAEPATVLRQGIESLTGYLDGRQPGANPAQLQHFLESEIAGYFDFEQMGWWAAGPLNRHLNQQQRKQLADLLKRRFIAVMSEQLAAYRGAQLVYLPPRGNIAQGDVRLAVRVMSVDAPPVQLDFRLYRNQLGQWRVYDVVANGLSAVSHYRNELAQLVRQHGVHGVLRQLN